VDREIKSVESHCSVLTRISKRYLDQTSSDRKYKQWLTQEFCSGGEGGSTNSVEDRGQRERGSGGSSPLVSGSGGSCNFVK
jgi:hypothetical protein